MTAGGNPYLSRVLENIVGNRTATFSVFVRGGTEERRISWGELEASAHSFRAAYRAAGMAQDAPILLFLRHVPELYGAFLGAMLGGYVPSFMPCPSAKQDPELYWNSHKALFARLKPTGVVADRATLSNMQANGLSLPTTLAIETLDPAPAEAAITLPPADAVALLQHSSGTTGLKKGVALSYAAVASQVERYAAAISLRPEDRIASWLPLYHDMGLVACLLLPLYAGVPLVQLDPFEWAARPGLLLEHITRHRASLCWVPNFALEHMASLAVRDAARYDLRSVRAFINCSEICRPASMDRFAAAFAGAGVEPGMMQCCYAMAETVFAVSQTPVGQPPRRLRAARDSLEVGHVVRADPDGLELVETGRVLDDVRLVVQDEVGAPLPEGTVGELAVRAPFLFEGYAAQPELTAQRLVDGTYRTRDLGFLCDGAVYVLGRMDDLVIVNGRNVYAHEVEVLITAVVGIKPGRAVALPWEDARAGSQGLVVVAERLTSPGGEGRPDAAIRSEILSRVFSVLNVTAKAVHLVEEGWLVKTTSGKISRSANLAKLSAQLAQRGKRQGTEDAA